MALPTRTERNSPKIEIHPKLFSGAARNWGRIHEFPVCHALTYDDDVGRWHVKLSSGETIRVRPANLRALDDYHPLLLTPTALDDPANILCPADAAWCDTWPAWPSTMEEVTDILKQGQAQDAVRRAVHIKRSAGDPKDIHDDSADGCRQVPVSGEPATEVLAESTAGKTAGLPAACPLRSHTKQTASQLIRRRWSAAEEERFLKALGHFEKTITIAMVNGRLSVKLGPTVAEIMSLMIKTRSAEQVRSHVQKHYIRLEREASRCRVVT